MSASGHIPYLGERESILAANVTFPTYVPKGISLYIPHCCLRTRNPTKKDETQKKKKNRDRKCPDRIYVQLMPKKIYNIPLCKYRKKRKDCNSSICTYMQKLYTCSIWQAYRFVSKEPVQDFPLLLLPPPPPSPPAPLSTYLYLTYLTYTYLGGTCT